MTACGVHSRLAETPDVDQAVTYRQRGTSYGRRRLESSVQRLITRAMPSVEMVRSFVGHEQHERPCGSASATGRTPS